ncbi:competence protein ComGB [Salinibacillus kushneri]|uniref:Competence protein ComGB n=1 Tax=Salinibacillus kushneri TaxID=237682 RepID=A0A1I0FUX0_9BACI|nr:competence type IV pilus assembly protein ComGB [Salinibacillus kushneri]SET62026.1 competence protein ComGB [Salinibacillus kushneri]
MLLVLSMNIRSQKLFSKDRKITLADQILLTKRLSALLQNGYTLNKALQLISLDPKQGIVAKDIQKYLIQGKHIDQIFQELGFSPIICSYLYFSRSTGQLGDSLENGYSLLHQLKQFQDQLKKVMQYPLLVFMFLILLMSGLKFFLLPSLKDLYKGLHGSGTTIIPQLFTSIEFFIHLFFLTCIFVLIITITWIALKSRLSTPLKIKIYSITPFFKRIKSLETSFLFSFHFSSLLQSGLSIKHALQVISEQKHLPIMKRYSIQLMKSIYAGQPLHTAIESFPLAEEELGFIFERSIQDGTLEKDLHNYAHLLVETFLEKVSKTITYIQPIFFILFGFIILFIYMSILMPMFGLIDQI